MAASAASSFSTTRMFRTDVKFDRRGKYNRAAEGVKKRLPLAQQAWDHRQAILMFNGQTTCSRTCPHGGRCFRSLSANDLLACHDESFGTSVYWDEQSDTPRLRNQSTAQTQKAWINRMAFTFAWDADGCLTLSYICMNKSVCDVCMRLACGIPESTWDTNNMKIGRSGTRAFEVHEASIDFAASVREDDRKDTRHGTSHSNALVWWVDWLGWCVQKRMALLLNDKPLAPTLHTRTSPHAFVRICIGKTLCRMRCYYNIEMCCGRTCMRTSTSLGVLQMKLRQPTKMCLNGSVCLRTLCVN